MLGAEGVFLLQNWKTFGDAARSDLQDLVILLVVNLFIGMGARFDNWGHLGGLIGGAAFAWLSGPILQIEPDPPGFKLVDRRSPAEAWRGAVIVGACFTILTIVVIWLRLN